MAGISKVRCLLGIDLFEISNKYINELRLAHKNDFEVFDMLPTYTINLNENAFNRPILAENYHQFIGLEGDDDKKVKHLYFNVTTIDRQLKEEISNASVEDLFIDFDFKEILSKFTPLNDDDLKNYVFPPINYLVIEITYITIQDYISGGWESEMELDIIGYLDNNLQIKMFDEIKKELKPSGIGIVVDKSNATATFPIRETVFQKGSSLNKNKNGNNNN